MLPGEVVPSPQLIVALIEGRTKVAAESVNAATRTAERTPSSNDRLAPVADRLGTTRSSSDSSLRGTELREELLFRARTSARIHSRDEVFIGSSPPLINVGRKPGRDRNSQRSDRQKGRHA